MFKAILYMKHNAMYITLQEGQLTPTVQRFACETPILPVWVGALGQNFTETRSTPAKMLIPFDRKLIAL